MSMVSAGRPTDLHGGGLSCRGTSTLAAPGLTRRYNDDRDFGRTARDRAVDVRADRAGHRERRCQADAARDHALDALLLRPAPAGRRAHGHDRFRRPVGRSATTASRPTRRTRCSRSSSPAPTSPSTRSSCSRRRTSPATAISPTRSTCSRERSRRTRDPSRCSSTRSDGRFRPSPCAVCVGASDDGIGAGSEHQHDQAAASACPNLLKGESHDRHTSARSAREHDG